ncbi:MAG: asparagine N-glycosylation enzyme membrane subunit Stt3 [Chlamydiales bacterium]|jgi:asparagine N-glycosylation enzyme membrane subunit Stt3
MLDAPPLRSSRWTWRSGLVLAIVALVSWFARDTLDRRVPVGAEAPGEWVTYDPDSLYQMRRLVRALDEDGPIAGHDEHLNYPLGSAIPWPPYYTLFLSGVLAPFAPETTGDAATALDATHRQRWIERHVASLPLLFGVLTSLLAAAAARRLAGDLAGLVAGLYHALCLASIAYSKAGNGDHHAWVTWLAGAMVVALSAALARKAHERPRAGLLWGGILGALAGVLLGSWVASIVYILEVQLVLAWLILRNARTHLPGLCAFGSAFHLVALLVSLPAVMASPWLADNPWQVVNLSWFHPAFLAAGALVFLPLPLLRARQGLRRAYPWSVGLALLSTGLALATLDTPAGLGMREGFQWMSKVNQFMAGISESRPLGGQRALTELGYGLLVLPVIWIALCWKGRRNLDLALLPFLVCVPLRALQASRQARFGDGLALPLAVLLGLGLAYVLTGLRSPGRPWRARAVYPLAALLVCLSHVSVMSSLGEALRGSRTPQVRREGPAYVAARELCEWLRTTDRSQSRHTGAVLANWSWGHCIEWVAGRPSLATNFGSYVGEEGFRNAPRFLLSENPRQASELLAQHDAAFVLVTSRLTRTLTSQIAAADPQLKSHFLQVTADGTSIRPRWFDTIGARLLLGGVSPGLGPDPIPQDPLTFLRLVQVSSVRDPSLTFPPGVNPHAGASPAAFLWERVRGASVTADGPPGTLLTVELTARFPRGRYSLTFKNSAIADENGRARVRIPYATASPSGNGVVPQELARFTFGARAGALHIPERAVLDGLQVDLESP